MKKNMLILFVLFLAVFSLFSQEIIINIDTAIKQALQNNKDIQMAKEELKKSKFTYDEAFSGALPRVDVSLTVLRKGYSSKISNMEYGLTSLGNGVSGINNYLVETDPNYHGTQMNMLSMPDEEVDAVKNNTISADLKVIQPIWLGGKVGTAIKIAKIYEKMSNESYNLAETNVIADTKKSFYNVLILQETMRVMLLVKKDADDNYGNLEKMFQQGLISEYDLIKAHVRVNAINPKITAIRNNIVLAKNLLKSKMGIDFSAHINLQGEILNIKIPDIKDYRDKAVKQRKELDLLRFKRDLLKQNVVIQKSGYYPNILALGVYNFQSSSDDYSDTFKKNHGVSVVNFGITANLSLFSGFETNAKVDKAQVEVKKTNLEIEKTEDLIKLQAEQSYNSILKAKEEITQNESSVKEAQKALDIANNRYKNEVGTELEVIDAQTQLEQAQLSKIGSLHDLINAVINFQTAIGEIN